MIKTISRIVISKGSKNFNIFDDIRLQVMPFKAGRTFKKLVLRDYTHATQDSGWEEQELKLDFHNMNSKKYDSFLEFIQEEDAVYTMEFTYGTKTFLTLVRLTGSEINSNNNNAHELRTLTLLQQTPFFRLLTYDYDVSDTSSTGQETYPYDFPLTFGNRQDTYFYGDLEFNIVGDGRSPLKLEIFGISKQPEIYVNRQVTETNNYKPDIEIPLGSTLVNNSFIPQKQMILNDNLGTITNIEQNREFTNSQGYLSCKKGKNKIEFYNVRKARVTVYEKYLQLR